MQTANYTVNSGGGVALWRGIPAELTISGIEDTTGDWLFLVDNDYADGVVLSGTVAASGENLVVTLAEMNTVELAAVINGKPTLQCRATLTDGASRVYLIPLTIKNRAVEGTPTPVAEYYTKAQIDAMIAGQIDLDYTSVTNKPQINGHTLTGDQTAADLGLLSAEGMPVVTLGEAASTITPREGIVYFRALQANDSFAFSTAGLTAAWQKTAELHLLQPATAVAFTLDSANLKWGDGVVFKSANSAPLFNEANTFYIITVRWDGRELLANLAAVVQ